MLSIQPNDDLEAIRTKLLALPEVSDADKAIFTAFASNQRECGNGNQS